MSANPAKFRRTGASAKVTKSCEQRDAEETNTTTTTDRERRKRKPRREEASQDKTFELPWSTVIERIVKDPEQLFSLQARVRDLQSLSLVDRKLHRDVTFFGWRAIASRMCMRSKRSIARRVRAIEHKDLAICTDAKLESMATDFYGHPHFFITSSTERKLFVQDLTDFRQRNIRDDGTSFDLFRVRLLVENARSTTMWRKDARSLYCLSKSDIDGLTRVSSRKVRLMDVLDVCRARYGTTAALEAQKAKREATARKRQLTIEMHTRRRMDIDLRCFRVLRDSLLRTIGTLLMADDTSDHANPTDNPSKPPCEPHEPERILIDFMASQFDFSAIEASVEAGCTGTVAARTAYINKGGEESDLYKVLKGYKAWGDLLEKTAQRLRDENRRFYGLMMATPNTRGWWCLSMLKVASESMTNAGPS